MSEEINNAINDEKIVLNVEKLFPEAARRVEILEGLQKTWAGVVGPVYSRCSFPYNLGINEISVAVFSHQAANMIKNMKGNILRALKIRYGYESVGDFVLKITQDVPREKQIAIPEQKKNIPKIEPNEERVKELMSEAPEDLPEDINYSISHLQALMEKLNS